MSSKIKSLKYNGKWDFSPSIESLENIWAIDQKFTPNSNLDTQKTIDLWKKRIAKLSTYTP